MSWEKVSSTKDRLREAMNICDKKQIDLVNETGINKGTISRYLSGKYEPKSDAVSKLAVALDCSETWLWGYDVPRQRKPEQKKNDSLNRVIKRMRSDTEFADMVMAFDALGKEEAESFRQFMKLLNDKNNK